MELFYCSERSSENVGDQTPTGIIFDPSVPSEHSTVARHALKHPVNERRATATTSAKGMEDLLEILSA